MRDHFLFIQSASMKSINKYWWAVGKWELLHLALGSTGWYNHFGDQFGYIIKVENVHTIWPTNAIFSICSRSCHEYLRIWSYSVSSNKTVETT